MEIFLTNGFVVTKTLANFVNECEDKGKEYLVVFTDGANFLFPESFRIDSLVGSLGYKVLPTDMMDHNESDENFAKAVNELIKKMGEEHTITKVYLESFNDADLVEELVKDINFDVITYNECRGHILKDKDVLFSHAYPKWIKRFGKDYERIVTSTIPLKHEDEIRFVVLSEDNGERLVSLAYDYDWNSYFFPDTSAREITEVEVFISVLGDMLGVDIDDYFFRTYTNDGVSSTVVFVLAKDAHSVFLSNKNVEVNDYSDFVTVPVKIAGQLGGKGAWISYMTLVDKLTIEAIDEAFKKE